MNSRDSKYYQRIFYKKLRKKQMSKVEKNIIQETKKSIESLIRSNKIRGYLGIYWPINDEADIRSLKTTLKIPIALPASHKGGYLTYHPWRENPLKKDFCGIPAPIEEPKLTSKQISLIIVPALAIDQNGYRLGSGGGFFDRLRGQTDWRAIPSLVLVPKACISNKPLPKESWDVPFDGWISEDGEFRVTST